MSVQLREACLIDLDRLTRLSLSTRYALALFGGVLNGAAFVFCGALTPLAHLPLLIALWGVKSARERAQLGALLGAVAGAHIYGVLNYGLFFFIAFILVCVIQMMLFGIVLGQHWGRLSAWHRPLLPASIWVLSEWLRTIGTFSMPASYAGCIASVEAFAPWLRWAAVGGGLFVSGLVALCPALLFELFFNRIKARKALFLWGSVLVALALHDPSHSPTDGTTLQVTAVQGGYPNRHYLAIAEDPWLGAEIVRSYERLSEQAFSRGAALVIWPETALHAPLIHNPALKQRLYPKGEGQLLIAGLLHKDQSGRTWNLAAALGDGRMIDQAAKVKTIPLSEAELTAGQDWWPLQTPLGSIGTLICFESLYAEAGRRLAHRGAELLVVMSNDAGFGYSPISAHMMNRAVVRAIESGRWLVRVGQAGLTSFIDPQGRRVGELPLFAQATLSQEIYLSRRLTPFVRWGHWWLFIPALILLIPSLRGEREETETVTS